MTSNTYEDNRTLWAASLNALTNAINGDAIVDGCGVSKGVADWDSDVAAGTVIAENSIGSVSSTTVSHTDPSSDADMDAGESRIDIIVSDPADNTAIIEGTAASDPVSPDITSGDVVLGFWVIAESDSSLADARLVDIPETADEQSVRYLDGSPDEIDPADLSGSSGTDKQVLQSDGSANAWANQTPTQVTFTTTVRSISASSYTELKTGTFDAPDYDMFQDTGTFEVLADPNGGIAVRIISSGGTTVAEVSSSASNDVELTATPTLTSVPDGERIALEAKRTTGVDADLQASSATFQ